MLTNVDGLAVESSKTGDELNRARPVEAVWNHEVPFITIDRADDVPIHAYVTFPVEKLTFAIFPCVPEKPATYIESMLLFKVPTDVEDATLLIARARFAVSEPSTDDLVERLIAEVAAVDCFQTTTEPLANCPKAETDAAAARERTRNFFIALKFNAKQHCPHHLPLNHVWSAKFTNHLRFFRRTT